MSSNQNIGRDELAAMLGASHASDMVAAAGATAGDLGGGAGPAESSATGTGRRRHHRLAKDGGDEDVSRMDPAQAAALVARRFAGGASSSAVGGAAGVTARHRAVGRKKRKLQHHLLVGDLIEQGISAMEGEEEEDVTSLYQKGLEEKEEEFVIRADAGGTARRKKTEAKVLMRRGRDEKRHSSSSDSESSNSSSSSSSLSDDSSRRRNRRRGRNSWRRNRRPRSNSSSSSSSEDEADIRRRRARDRSRRNQNERGFVTSDHCVESDKLDKEKNVDEPKKNSRARRSHSDDDDDVMSVEEKKDQSKKEVKKDQSKNEVRYKEVLPGKSCRGGLSRRLRSDGSTSSSSSSSSSSESLSSSDQSSSEQSDQNIPPMCVSKPLFVPKSKRGTAAEIERQQQKMEEAEKRRALKAEKDAVRSRAIVAEAVSALEKNGARRNDEEDEFDTGEAGGEFLAVPDDADPTEEDSPDRVQAERDAWEVRELVRILRDFDAVVALESERRDLERRRALTDGERLAEDRASGQYRTPGEDRRGKRGGEVRKSKYLQRFHHRGAFYMDEDTLAQAGEEDVRHRAAEYSRAATGEDKIDKSLLPEVMQVKRFGFAGYSTKYKGLAKEDTTDRNQKMLPLRKKAPGGGGRRNGGGSGGGGGERYGNGGY